MAVIYLLSSSLGATVLALLPGVLAPLGDITLRLLNAATGVTIAGLAGWVRFALLRKKLTPRFPWVPRVLGPVAWSAAALQLLAVLGVGPAENFLAVGLWWLIVAAAAQFVVQVVATFQSQDEGAA